MGKWVLGYAPYTKIPGLEFDDKKEAQQRAKEENKCGPYRGRGVNVYKKEDLY